MGTQRPFRDKVTVRFRKRDDGGLVATCEQVNGFYLSGGDPRAVMADVIPVLETLFRCNIGINVQAHPLKYGHYSLTERQESSEGDVDQIPLEQDYVLERVAA